MTEVSDTALFCTVVSALCVASTAGALGAVVAVAVASCDAVTSDVGGAVAVSPLGEVLTVAGAAD